MNQSKEELSSLKKESDSQRFAKIENFIYKQQFNSKMNPFYIVFTEKGLIFFIASYYVYDFLNGGVLPLLLCGFIGRFIYQNFFPFRYHELEKLSLVKFFSDVVNDKRERAKKERYIYFKK